MNLLARILSHGFAFAVVVLLILVLVYRGDLFQEGELPEFLSFKHQPASTEEAGSDAVYRATEEQASTAGTTAAIPEEDLTSAPGSTAAVRDGEVPPVDDTPAVSTESSTSPEAMPATDTETVAPAEQAEPDEGIDTAPASVPSTIEVGDEPSVPVPSVNSNESAAEPADEATASAFNEAVDENITTAEVQPVAPDSSDDSAAVSAEAIVETTVEETITAVETQTATPDSSDESIAESADAETVTTVDSTPAETSHTVEAPLVTAPEEVTPETTTPAAIEPPVVDTVSPMESLAAPETNEISQANTATVAETPYKVLAKARESFWLRDFEAAEQQYRKLTRLEPDNPDGYGELGNMYFSQGKWDEAAAAYYEAGTRLLNEGLVPQAREMLEVIRGLNGSQASDLEAQIADATATSP